MGGKSRQSDSKSSKICRAELKHNNAVLSSMPTKKKNKKNPKKHNKTNPSIVFIVS